jgi:predicted metalloprotease
MRWRGGRASGRVEDRRGMRIGGGAALGGGGLILVLLISALMGIDPRAVLDATQGVDVGAGPAEQGPTGAPADEAGRFAAVVLGSTEDVWNEIFAERGARYDAPRLVLFSDAVRSACGTAQSAVGPFYCPRDGQVYIDLTFFRELDQRFGAPGDFAQAYVIAHEVGHHVQNLTGRTSQGSSVGLELEADCFAGVWGNRANRRQELLEPGDVEEGLAAAAAIGDDTLQRRSGSAVQPETWTHGSSDQRVRALRTGLQSGNIDDCQGLGSR